MRREASDEGKWWRHKINPRANSMPNNLKNALVPGIRPELSEGSPSLLNTFAHAHPMPTRISRRRGEDERGSEDDGVAIDGRVGPVS